MDTYKIANQLLEDTLTFEIERQKLDYDKLKDKAFKITVPEGDSKREGFSIITPFTNKGVWNKWKTTNKFDKIVKKESK